MKLKELVEKLEQEKFPGHYMVDPGTYWELYKELDEGIRSGFGVPNMLMADSGYENFLWMGVEIRMRQPMTRQMLHRRATNRMHWELQQTKPPPKSNTLKSVLEAMKLTPEDVRSLVEQTPTDEVSKTIAYAIMHNRVLDVILNEQDTRLPNEPEEPPDNKAIAD